MALRDAVWWRFHGLRPSSVVYISDFYSLGRAPSSFRAALGAPSLPPRNCAFVSHILLSEATNED